MTSLSAEGASSHRLLVRDDVGQVYGAAVNDDVHVRVGLLLDRWAVSPREQTTEQALLGRCASNPRRPPPSVVI
jgi:hypothetical protein